MKKLFILLLLSLPALAANYNDAQFQLGVVDQNAINGVGYAGSTYDVSSNVLVFVYDAGTKTLSTIYSDRKRTAKTNPISRAQFATDGGVLFYGPNASYDVFLAHSDGSVARHPGVKPILHRLVLSRTDSARELVIPFTGSNNVETDTGIDLLQDSIVNDVRVNVTTAKGSGTISVGTLSSGTGGSATGFLNATSTNATGYPAPAVVTVGTNTNYLSAFTYGTLLGNLLLGTDAAGRFGQTLLSGYVVTPSNTTRVTYTTSAGDTTSVGYIHVFFRLFR